MTWDLQTLRTNVIELYQRNRQQGRASWCDHDYDFVCPSSGTYPFQWFWDSCFHAIALTHIDIERAKSEIRSLVANAQPDGLIAHVTFWQRERYEDMLKTYSISYRTPHLSDCIQPPIVAEAVAAIFKASGDTKFLRAVVPPIRAYFDWLDRVRDPDHDGLISILQPDESGLDHSPKFDAYLGVSDPSHEELTRGWQVVADAYSAVERDPAAMFKTDQFNVEDVMVNTLYAENQRVLADLLNAIGHSDSADMFRDRAERTTEALIRKCWSEDDQLFYDLAGKEERPLAVKTFSSLMPLFLRDLPKDKAKALIGHLEDPKTFQAEFSIPTVSMDEPGFCATESPGSLVFRGTTWMNVNWYLTRGLRRHGRDDLATRIENQSVALIEKSGFREYYNPHTGDGYGAKDFSWTALALDMLANRES